MATTIPPAHSKIAATLDWETATVEDVWSLELATGIPADAILSTLHDLFLRDAESRR